MLDEFPFQKLVNMILNISETELSSLWTELPLKKKIDLMT